MKWIKASERLPDSYDAHEKHVRLNGKKVLGIFVEGPKGGLVFEYREPVGGYRIIKDLSNVEWLDESPASDEWVKVDDGLPGGNCDVLVVKNNGKVFQMSYHQPFDTGKKIFQWWGFGKWIDQHSQVTHWRNFPSPPKK